MTNLNFLKPRNAREELLVEAMRNTPLPEECLPGKVGEIVREVASHAPEYPIGWVFICVLDRHEAAHGGPSAFGYGESLRESMVADVVDPGWMWAQGN